ncbi:MULTISPECIES: substrate-binding domain-containing protein [unclassified Paracoccus (in: a-proteobacteria)]|uniref:substrate-binding domain-containing protein n=1 Tax=unclassified Paracoccus (in: a-proteobacteria) TaxID=2688777 RepID=UPI0012B2ACDD|nr:MULTISPECIES: helix-turn-helix transcriptional regulator [unclassified Paracoccus (in: a-proteobacteria)]UXU74313.1 helix-turn-helix transcriptional regulator [Paracoccus sp. SMMA_5]UXU80203.1 helix-turn-helix transcriptional regulator [Paracoccus sp. SMMA_5_TC]
MATRDAMTAEDMAAALGISKSGVYALIRSESIGFYKVGRKIRFTEAHLRDYLERAERKTAPGPDPDHRHQVDLSPPRADNGFVICGQDLILDILSNALRLHGIPALRAYIGSYSSLVSLYHDRVGAATAHLWDSVSDEYNLPHVRALLPGIRCTIVNITWRMQGFYVARGNPKGITGWRDLGRGDIRIINREKGAGSRVLLDENLKLLGLYGSSIAGYDDENQSHLALASAVGRGDADVAVGIEKIARQVDNIDFVPLQRERYDLVIKTEHLDRPEVRTMLDILRSERFRNEFMTIGGYDLRDIGRVMHQT